MRKNRLALACCLVAGTFLTPNAARANGQSTHLWISHEAVEHLAPGPLRTLVEAHLLMIDNGTMFPDGGYPLGDPYAELAHWEPFQVAYMNWVMDQYAFPYEGEGAEHVAFMLGLNSHGMADQTFDALYMERTLAYDGDKDDLDTQSDIAMMAQVGGGFSPPEDWVPYDVLDQIYSDAVDFDADPSQMQQGQGLLRLAILAVKSSAENPDDVAEAMAAYPWGNSHLLDETVPGSPPCQGEVIARYWQSQWELVHGRDLYRPILSTWPVDGGAGHDVDSSSIESWVSMAFARGLEASEVGVDDFEIRSEEGVLVPFNVNVFYGQDSHLVHLKPTANFELDTTYTVTVHPGIADIHGGSFEDWSWTFSTGAVAPDPLNPAWGEGLDGSDGSDGSEAGEDETSSDEGMSGVEASGDAGAETTETGTGQGSGSSAGQTSNGDSGCACQSSARGSDRGRHLFFGIGFALLFPVVRRRRPRLLRSASQESNLPR